MEKEQLVSQLIERRDEYNKKRLELEKDYKRNETMYLAYGLFEKCINEPHKVVLSKVNKEIANRKHWLEEHDLILLRGVFNLIKNDLDVAMGEVLGARRIE